MYSRCCQQHRLLSHRCKLYRVSQCTHIYHQRFHVSPFDPRLHNIDKHRCNHHWLYRPWGPIPLRVHPNHFPKRCNMFFLLLSMSVRVLELLSISGRSVRSDGRRSWRCGCDGARRGGNYAGSGSSVDLFEPEYKGMLRIGRRILHGFWDGERDFDLWSIHQSHQRCIEAVIQPL